MANQKAYFPTTQIDLLKEYKKDRKKQYGILRQNHTKLTSIGSQPLGGSGRRQDTGNQIQESFLKKSGDTMVGPFATRPGDVQVQDDGGTKFIDIGSTSQDFTSNVVVLGEGGLPSNLDRIDGVAFFDQWLIVQAVLTTPITLKHNTANIWMPSGTDYEVVGGESVLLKYDSTNGRWVLMGIAGAVSSISDPIIVGENDLGIVSGNVDIDWSIANFHRMVLDGDVDIDMLNTPVTGKWEEIIVQFRQNPLGGGHSVTFNDSFENDVTPNILTGAGRYTTVRFYSYNDGSVRIFAFETIGGGTTGLVPGGGGQFDGFGGYITSKLSADQTSNLTTGNHIEFDTAIENDTIVVSSGSGQANGIFSGLRKGHTYECECGVAVEGAAADVDLTFQFFDVNGNQFIGSHGYAHDTTNTTNRGPQHLAKAFFKPNFSSDTLEVRIVQNTSVTKILSGDVNTKPMSYVTLHDVGVTESVINEPNASGILDVRHFFSGFVDTGSVSPRYARINGAGQNATQGTDGFRLHMLEGGIFKKLLVNAVVKGAGERTVKVLKNGIDTSLEVTLPASATGVEIKTANVQFDEDDTVDIETSGGASNDEFTWVLVTHWQ